MAEGQSLEELRRNLARQLVEYAKDYQDNFPRDFHAPNTRSHLPYVLRILLEEDVTSVTSLLHGDAELE